MLDEQIRKSLEQWWVERTFRLVRRVRQTGEWINFGESADFIARESGSIAPDEQKRARAYDELAEALIKGEFDERERTRVFHPSGSKKVRMTREWLAEVIDIDEDGDRGHWRLSHCWAPRELMARFLRRRRLPFPAAVFGPPTSERKPATRQTGVAGSRRAAHSPAPQELNKNERKRAAVDATIKEVGIDLFTDMSAGARQKEIKRCAAQTLGNLTITDRYVSKRLAAAKAEREERS
jgi:hypothetical protein